MKRLLGTALLLLALPAWAKRDLSAGIVFPSTNSAVVQNPGAMTAVGNDRGMVDITAYLDSDFNPYGGHGGYAKAKDYLAYGLLATANDVTASASVKVSSTFHAGLGVDYSWSSQTYSVPAGIWLGLSGGLKVAVMTGNILSPGFLTFGLAGTLGGGAVLELDMIYYRNYGSFDPSSVYFQPAFVFTLSRKFSFKADYAFQGFPNFDPGAGGPGFGISYWVGETFGLYAGYNDFAGGYQVGVRAGPK